jgi:hypothetical protein
MTKTLVGHWKDCDVRIDRKTPWGNPFSHKAHSTAEVIVESELLAVELFARWLQGKTFTFLNQPKRRFILENVHTLKGKRLGCWGCKNCHGDVLVRLANPPEVSPHQQQQLPFLEDDDNE